MEKNGSKNQIKLSLIKNDTDLMYENLSYNFRDVNGKKIEGVIPLNQLGIEPVAHEFDGLAETPEGEEIEKRVFLEKDKILEIIESTGVAIDKTKLNHNKTLLRMLNNYESTALDMAETLTLCRFNLEFLQDVLTQCSADERVLTTRVLNSQSSGVFNLYKQIRALPSEGTQTDAFENEVKSFLLKHASSKETNIKALNALLNQCPSSTIKQSMSELVENIVQEKELIAQATSFYSQINDISPDELKAFHLQQRWSLGGKSVSILHPLKTAPVSSDKEVSLGGAADRRKHISEEVKKLTHHERTIESTHPKPKSPGGSSQDES